MLSPLLAHATSPHLASISPPGAQRGIEVEITLSGARLSDTAEIFFYEPGIEVLQLASRTNNQVRAQIKIASDCRLGEHHLRLRAATGISELRTFFVGPFPSLAEVEPNNEPAKAQKIALNSTVTGTVPNEDQDCFLVEARKGQRLSAEVEAMRLGGAAFDPRLTLFDARGNRLADVDDTWLAQQDAFASVVAPEDGLYLVQLREASYGGGDGFHYRLHVGAFPRPTALFPPGGQVGETLAVKFFSEATGEFAQQVRLPGVPQEKLGVFAELEGQSAPSPNWLRVSTFPNVLEALPNQDREHAIPTDLPPPLAFNGVIAQKGETDWFRFGARKGQALEVNVFARRLRSPMDSVVEVYDARGNQVAANDDASGPDSAVKFTPSETTNYFLRIRDQLGGGGRDYTYRAEVVPVEPALSLKIPEVARNDTQTRQWMAVPRGNRCATLIAAKRVNFSGELVLGADSLPPGIGLIAEHMAANIDALPLVFEAAADAPIGGRLLDLTATWTNAAQHVTGTFHQDVELVPGPNNTFYYGTRVDKLCVAVTKEVPFRLRLIEPKVPLVQAGSMRLEVVAERDPGFDEPVTVQMVWNPPGVSSQSEITVAKGATNAFYPINAGGGAETRSWKIAVLGHAKVDGGDVFVSSQLTPLEVATPFVSGKIDPLALNPGQCSNLVVRLEQLKPFEGKATLRLYGLPERVTTTEKEITKSDHEVAFALTVATNSPFGSHKALFCVADVPQAGQVIPHTIAQGGIVRVTPPKKPEPSALTKAEVKK